MPTSLPVLLLKEPCMAKRKKSSRSRAVSGTPGSTARSAHGTLQSYNLGALPILDHILERMKL